MRIIKEYLTKYTDASTGFSDGRFKDDSGTNNGSEGIVQSANDWYYAVKAMAKKYIGVFSDTSESEDASDNLNSVETAIGIKNQNVLEWDDATNYQRNDLAIYLGLQFVSVANNNQNLIPIDNLVFWLPCFERNDAVIKWRNGDDIPGAMSPLHNFRDAAYLQSFSWGKYNFGGFAGRNFEATGVHLDGTVITGDATLEAIFDVGGGNQYHLLDVIAPEVVGVRTLLDARGAAAAVVDDAIAGSREDVGVYQDDAAQRVTGSFSQNLRLGETAQLLTSAGGLFSDSIPVTRPYPTNITFGVSGIDGDTFFDNAGSTSPNASKTDDLETRMKNYSVGVPSILVLNEI